MIERWTTNPLEIIEGTIRDYEALKEYHYRQEKLCGTTAIYKIRAKEPHTHAFPDPIGVIVYRMPIPDLLGRTAATNGFFHQPQSRSERMRLVNKHIRYIARIIIDPRFQKIGLGTLLLNRSLEMQTIDLIETLTPVSQAHSIFLNCGFKAYITPSPYRYRQMKAALWNIGLTTQSFDHPEIVQRRLDALEPGQKRFIEQHLRNFLNHFKTHKTWTPGIERTTFMLNKLFYANEYFIWKNPASKLNLEIWPKIEKTNTKNYKIAPKTQI